MMAKSLTRHNRTIATLENLRTLWGHHCDESSYIVGESKASIRREGLTIDCETSAAH
jgi:hypothetical protein